MRQFVLTAVVFAMTAAAQAADLTAMLPAAIAEIIDVRSFPSSIGPRREDHLKTFRDYGFTDVSVVDGTVELHQADRSWMFAVTVLLAGEDHVVLCILDKALGGPTYHTQDPEAFELGPDGLLVATGEKLVAPACPHRGE
jgi:hypothetical protein